MEIKKITRTTTIAIEEDEKGFTIRFLTSALKRESHLVTFPGVLHTSIFESRLTAMDAGISRLLHELFIISPFTSLSSSGQWYHILLERPLYSET